MRTTVRVVESFSFSRGATAFSSQRRTDLGVANREMGTIEKIEGTGNLKLRFDSGRTVAFNIKDNRHLDYGYAVTSHGSQGQTAIACSFMWIRSRRARNS